MVISSSFGASLAVYISCSILRIPIPLEVYLLYCFFSMTFVTGIRLSFRILRRLRIVCLGNDVKEYKKVMIIGAGEAGAMVI